MNDRETIVERIRKLLRLARDKGASENEAAVAMAKAQKLMLEHDISNVEEKVEEVAVRGDWRDADVDDKWVNLLSQAAAKLYNCRTVKRGMMGKYQVQFVGKPSNVLVAADTFEWLMEQVQALYKQGLRTFKSQMGGSLAQSTRGDFRRSFKEACALRVFHRAGEIVAASRNQIPDHMALVVIDQSLAAADDLIS